MATDRPRPTSFRDIRVWQNAMQLTVDIFQLAGTLPQIERPGLATSLQRAATIIPTAIATGHKSGSRTGMLRGCQEAMAAASELETLLIIVGQTYPNVPSNDLLDQLDEVQQMLIAVVRRLSTKTGPSKAI